jgi:hypothetical protein
MEQGPILPGGSLRTVTVSVPVTADGHRMNIQGRITLPSRPYVAVFGGAITGRPDGVYKKSIAALPPGSYQVELVVKDLDIGATETGDLQFEVPAN